MSISQRLRKKGVTREAVDREYLSSIPEWYGRTRFYIPDSANIRLQPVQSCIFEHKAVIKCQ